MMKHYSFCCSLIQSIHVITFFLSLSQEANLATGKSKLISLIVFSPSFFHDKFRLIIQFKTKKETIPDGAKKIGTDVVTLRPLLTLQRQTTRATSHGPRVALRRGGSSATGNMGWDLQ